MHVVVKVLRRPTMNANEHGEAIWIKELLTLTKRIQSSLLLSIQERTSPKKGENITLLQEAIVYSEETL